MDQISLYLCPVNDPLAHPVFSALSTGDRHMARGSEHAKFFDEEVSPFADFDTDPGTGFKELHELLPPKRRILFATPEKIETPQGWILKAYIEGLQFVYRQDILPANPSIEPAPLNGSHVDEMVALATLTKPGPFSKRTIEFGHYHGIFEEGRLAAMTGQRLHINNFTEISAVCTHPDFLGKGYAAALIQHQLHIILSHNETPFLHVRSDNKRAIEIYERLGFKENRDMHFYFLERV